MYTAKIYVTYKPSIVDPQGEVIQAALQRMNYQGITSVTQGKYFEVNLAAPNVAAAKNEVADFTDALLINQNTETYRFELVSNDDEVQS
ncbi:phosphoribosylformylglycinamidine synthase subunit PurS [Convivina intestini]|uniref:Phosphoribosylformylglycinamidine synthase subunit PurS n=1 Tax=Convivina intestini TaxID=1505726 RepID=A0A2U1DFJ1_9LACO|nr:phosphoribosylformylglycinamidine synthase subunit PurS [Convivina intestini]PVY86312.1 phosphoribosylformylglycinamidine synthase [Convivina intestini]CAH1850907.1 Phosphoribosylformylglycinamidine synthase subunit PurS [Convivina intestini]CAH1851638.1 Phosphoribosylformylglycinamidine synthase subunit PurS [Convivina intestini]SDB82401.1 phosphoribosylformylglycinamidine synthase [Leuconostocaceae bacterium R-53105]